MVCFVVLFVQLNRLTVFQAAELNDNPNNTRDILRDFSQPRGSITTADGVVIARSVPSDDRFEYQREYPEGPLFAHITGFFSFTLGSSGVEKTYNDELAGRTLELSFQELGDLFVDKDRVGDLTLTVRDDLQRIAAEQLGAARGLGGGARPAHRRDPHDGVVPRRTTRTCSPTTTPAKRPIAQALLDADPEKPRLARSYQERFFPGSTFKVVTATAGILHGGVTADEPVYPVTSSYTPPGTTRPIRNFGGSLLRRRAVPDPARVVQHRVRPDGRGHRARPDDRGVRGLRLQPGRADRPHRTGPLELPDRLRAEPPGAGPVVDRPERRGRHPAADGDGGGRGRQRRRGDGAHVLRDVRDPDGNVVDTYDPEVWTTAMDEPTADLMREAMRGVVDERHRHRGSTCPASTSAARPAPRSSAPSPPRSHAWVIGFAGPEGEEPTIAIAVIVEGQPGASEQTGGRVAAPIAQAVLAAYLQGVTLPGAAPTGAP